VAATRQFANLTSGRDRETNPRETSLAIVDVFDDFYKALDKISRAV